MGELENFRRIPVPPADYTARMFLQPPIRRRRALDYVKTTKRFLVELLFNSDVDLALFERFIVNTPIRMTEYATGQECSRIFISDSRVPDNANQEDVWRWAHEELPRIQAAISIQSSAYHPAKVRGLIEFFPGGKVGAIPPPLPVRVVGANQMPALIATLQSNSDFLSPYVQKSESDSDFKEAMMYCGQALGFEGATQWANLYRVYEVVADRFGGHDGIVNELKVCSKNGLDRFKRTVNHQEAIGAFSRHARLNYEPPPNPMAFETAVRFVLDLMAAWFCSGK
jgi:hypothetical protein